MTQKYVDEHDGSEAGMEVKLPVFGSFTYAQILGEKTDATTQRKFLTRLRNQARDAGLDVFAVPKDDSKLNEMVQWAIMRYNKKDQSFYDFMDAVCVTKKQQNSVPVVDETRINTKKEDSEDMPLDWIQLYNTWISDKGISEYPLKTQIEFLYDFNNTQKKYISGHLEETNAISIPVDIESLTQEAIIRLTSRVWSRCKEIVLSYFIFP